jgi:hypothetical protein
MGRQTRQRARAPKFRRAGLALALVWGVAATACGGRRAQIDTAEELSMGGNIGSDLEVARGARVFFAHQSVGFNILAGVEQVSRTAGPPIKIVARNTMDASGRGPVWVQSPAGKNGEPKTKVDFFVRTLTGDPSFKVDLALMKFCYVDFTPETDVADLFGYYQRGIEALKQARPDVRIAHATVPLKERPHGFKSALQRAIGQEVPGDIANVKRAEFNQRLLQTFGSDPVFDVARIESTRVDGTRETFEQAGQTYYSLNPRFSSDGGHLNDVGQRVLGAEMIRFVARALKPEVAGSHP